VHDRTLQVMKASARSALLNSTLFQTKMCQEGTLAEVLDSRRILNVVEHLGGKTVHKRAQD
jgi:hypothetical protein